jgi:penicillin-binding protein 1A
VVRSRRLPIIHLMSESDPSHPKALRGESATGAAASGSGGNGATVIPFRGKGGGEPPKPPKPKMKIRKLRVFALLLGLGLLAAVSTVFGMMMAVASDLPELEEPASRNTVIYDKDGNRLGLLTGNQRRIYLRADQIAPVMKHAIIAVEDRRFYTNEGVDLRGIARALYQDVINQKIVQGGSTITQQFVKNSIAAQDRRTLFVKMREAAMAYHITRKWPKEKILRTYLNTIYFGNGAYGIESAARTYFQTAHPGCERDRNRPCAAQLEPHEAALIAGMVSSPSGYDPLTNPPAARERRDLVLLRMLEQGFLTREQYESARQEPLPTRKDIRPPYEDTRDPYFTSWIKQQVVDQLGGGQEGARLAFEGGLRVRTTLDRELQEAAAQAVNAWLPNLDGPRAAVVVIENRTGKVRAMYGGDDYQITPFNLVTQGQRQPGSAFKPFILAEALKQGITPNSVWSSKKLTLDVPKSKEVFTVENYEDAYAGITNLARATTFSDNSVFTQVGIKVGTSKVARLARRMGIRTPVSDNWAMTLGGLREGVTPLDMAHAYATFAAGGKLMYGSMSPGAENPFPPTKRWPAPGPAGIEAIERHQDDKWRPIELPSGERAANKTKSHRVLDEKVAGTVASMLQGVVRYGTATRAQIDGQVIAGKTGTTENYGDAWFVGFSRGYTVAVWVGYPDEFKPMKTEFQGEPVAGGTYPAGIFKTFAEALNEIDPPKEEEDDDELPETPPTAPSTPGTPAPTTPAPAPTTPAPTGGTGGTEPEEPAPEEPAPAETAPAEPAPAEPAPAEPAPAPDEPAPPTGGDPAPPPSD